MAWKAFCDFCGEEMPGCICTIGGYHKPRNSKAAYEYEICTNCYNKVKKYILSLKKVDNGNYCNL